MLIISAKAQVVRISTDDVRETGRIAQGVILWKERETDDYVASIAVFQETDRNGHSAPSSNGHRRNDGRPATVTRPAPMLVKQGNNPNSHCALGTLLPRGEVVSPLPFATRFVRTCVRAA